MNIGSKDVISNLPEALIGHILSFLPTKNAASTSVLSKRWRYMLAFVPNLDFDDKIYGYYEMGKLKRRTSFQLFVDRVIALQGNASVRKVSLRCKQTHVDSARIDSWISNVLDRGVVDLSLYVSTEYCYPLPSEVLMSKTLVKLKVASVDVIDIGQVFLPRLKTLYLDEVRLENGAAFAKLISSCTAHEELVMIDVNFDHSRELFLVSNPTLKRVKLCFDYGDNPKSVSFHTPNLVYLKYNDAVAIKYPKVSFDSLVEAKLDLQMRRRHPYRKQPLEQDSANETDFFMGICIVEILYLSATTLEVLALYCNAIPIFSKLIHLA